MIRKSNPNLFHFNIDSSFFFEPRYSSFHYEKLLNKNSMKPDNNEINVLKYLINTINNKINENE